VSLTASAVTTAAAVAARPSWAEERRLDRAERARLDREREDARAARQIAEREAAQRLRQAAAEASRAQRAEAAEARAARLAALGGWTAGHVTELLFVPVIGVPAVLAWTAMATYGAHLYGPWGRALPAFSEGAMWAFAAAVTITRHRHPGRPVWHLRTGTVVFAAFGAVLNFAHGLTLPHIGSPVTGVVMALVSVAGVTAHQLTTAGPRRPRRTRAERDADRIAREIRKREMAARTEAVKAATVQLAADGTARLTFPADPSPAAGHDASPSAERDASPPSAPPKRSPRAAPGSKRAQRTDTETRIAQMRAKHPELTGPQIADRLGISPRTVRRYPTDQTSA
jgi:DNA-binding CsgD family transcriptional regulator